MALAHRGWGGPLKVWELALEEPAVNKHTYIVPAMSCTVFNYQQRQGIKESFEVGGLPPSLTLCPHIASVRQYRTNNAFATECQIKATQG